MKKITADVMPISALSDDDKNRFAQYVWEMRHLNMFDMNVLTYPRTVMLRASDETEPLLYMPLQSVLMFDAIAPQPGLSPRQEALSLRRIDDLVEDAAKQTGHREVYFFCRDDRVADLCANHGYEEIKNVRLLRKKLTQEIIPNGYRSK